MSDLQHEAAQAIPVSVLTGFLGSGKTTLLNVLIAKPGMAETAVLINEFGEIGLDHLLVRNISEDIVMLNSGCLCCTVRGDLVTALRDLFLKRVRGDVPEYRRVLIETTGLADPAPVLHTLMTDPLIGARYRLDGVVTTIDAVNGSRQLDENAESVKQAAVADRLVLTKTDLADPTEIEILRARLRQLNPAAPILLARNGEIDPAEILDAGLFNAKTKIPDVASWLKAEAYVADHGHHHHHHDVNRHDERVRAFSMTFDEPVSWTALAQALSLLISTQGDKLLRLKGIVNAQGHEQPLAVHGVQHVFHPPVPLPSWPSENRRTKLVFITRDLSQNAVESLIRTILAA